MLKPDEIFLPAIEGLREMHPDGDFYHGENCYVHPSTTAVQQARRQVAALDEKPNVATIITTYPHDCLLMLQHRFQQGFYVADESILAWREDFQSVQLFKRLD